MADYEALFMDAPRKAPADLFGVGLEFGGDRQRRRGSRPRQRRMQYVEGHSRVPGFDAEAFCQRLQRALPASVGADV